MRTIAIVALILVCLAVGLYWAIQYGFYIPNPFANPNSNAEGSVTGVTTHDRALGAPVTTYQVTQYTPPAVSRTEFVAYPRGTEFRGVRDPYAGGLSPAIQS